MVGLELHDRTVTALLVGDDGRVLGRDERACGRGVETAAVEAVEAVVRAAGAPLVSIGITSATPDVPSYAAATSAIAQRFGGPFLHDGVVPSGTAAAVAESWVGAAAGASDIVYFAVGDHAVSGTVIGGRPVAGAHRRAGAAAWLALNPVERDDYRKHGCLEAEVAAAGIVRRLVWRVKAGDHSRVQDAAGGDLAAITLDMVLDGARSGDGVAISVIRDTAKYLGMAAANLVVVVDPGAVVLGGIMADAADLLFEPVRVEIARRLPASMATSLRIVKATLGRDAAAIGAARLAAAAVA